MLKQIVKLEHTIGSRTYQFLCDQDSPTVEIKAAIFEIIAFVKGIEDQAKANADAQAAAQAPAQFPSEPSQATSEQAQEVESPPPEA